MLDAAILTTIGLALTIFSAIWSLAWWLSSKFNVLSKDLREQIETVEQHILDKLEYHERHDDARFLSVRNDIWELRLDNATRDSIVKKVEIDKDPL